MSGFSPEKLADENVQRICDQAKAEVEKTTSKTYEEFTAVKYKEQSGAGQTFIIKVRVDNWIHLSVYKNPSGKIMLNGVQQDKNKPDSIEPF
ncbi:cystatin-A [Lates calcarifer]|uniref:Cystatin-A n=1 Tax=Lates calcarifer TaxID=8187 RepID=A0AAJ7LQ94_LATCA|nr:cystatin-A [Lates calcarifer]